MIVSTWRRSSAACLGELDRPAAARPVEQADPERALERHHVLADRRLRVVEGVGCPVERPLVRHRAEAEQLAEAEVGEGLREDAAGPAGTLGGGVK